MEWPSRLIFYNIGGAICLSLGNAGLQDSNVTGVDLRPIRSTFYAVVGFQLIVMGLDAVDKWFWEEDALAKLIRELEELKEEEEELDE